MFSFFPLPGLWVLEISDTLGKGEKDPAFDFLVLRGALSEKGKFPIKVQLNLGGLGLGKQFVEGSGPRGLETWARNSQSGMNGKDGFLEGQGGWTVESFTKVWSMISNEHHLETH